MRILFANPNTTTAVTDRIAAVARDSASPGTEVVAVTAPYGVPYIATRAEAVIGGRVALELLAEHAGGCDAAVIAAFADPGIGGARELLAIPVIGMAEAAMLTACMLGRRFSIVTFATAMGPWYRECVDYNGLSGRLASIRCVPGGFRDINTVAEEKADVLVEACRAAVEQDEADVVILGGAPLAGLAATVADRVPVPLVDGVAATVRQAEVLAGLKPRKATAGTFRTPDPKPVTGVPVLLEALFTRR
ncbi:MAG: aspartate/glutamate racemase family protein [Rhodopila sp.]